MGELRRSDRRDFEERRKRPTPFISKYWLVGRRRGGRRRAESKDIYVDRYRPIEWALIVLLVTMCLADMLLTLDYLEAGGEEANPIMALALRGGNSAFVAAKMGLTLLGAFVLLVRVRFARIMSVLVLLVFLYSALMVYHGYIRSATPPSVAASTGSELRWEDEGR
jgi:hypothetical protein